jgi:hypothetical protein
MNVAQNELPNLLGYGIIQNDPFLAQVTGEIHQALCLAQTRCQAQPVR